MSAIDLEQVEKIFSCLITSLGEMKRAGRGSYAYIPGLGDTTLFVRPSLWDRVYFSPDRILGQYPIGEERGVPVRDAGVIIFHRETEVPSQLEIGRMLKNCFGTIFSALGMPVGESESIASYCTGHYFAGKYVTESNKEEIIFERHSQCVQIGNITVETIICFGAELARAVGEKAILLRDFGMGRSLRLDLI